MVVRQLVLVALFLGACNRTPEPNGGSNSETTSEGGEKAGGAPQQTPSPPQPEEPPEEGAACTIAMSETAPETAMSLDECPEDPDGRPEMPFGTVEFTDAPQSPKVRVELALTDEHRQHGLMFRPALSDEEGMLFTFPGEAVRTFWMHNTCLALDLLFIEESGYISGILEQVPPWNDSRRSVPCRVQHVLELRAGWARDHGVAPGQKITIETSLES